jgi:hypothetical protein
VSLLLLLSGGEVVAGNDRTFDATWEQAAAGWEAVAVKLNADGSFAQDQSWSATMVGPGVPEPEDTGRPLVRLEKLPAQFGGYFTQPPASWRAVMVEDDDELTLRIAGVL